MLGQFSAGREEREAAKGDELAPYIEKALARKERIRPLDRHEVPVVEASVVHAGVPISTVS